METQRRDPFVGRKRELGTLLAGLAAAASGQGRVVLLAGEPGIGKTRTAEEFARRARAEGIEVLVGRCYEGDGAPAFWPWLQVLRAYTEARDPQTLAAELGTAAPDVAAVYPELRTRLPGLAPAPVLDPEHARFRFFDGVTRALLHAAATRPVVLLFDDLHGADKPSLLLLQFLARALRESHLLVVGGLRDFALAREHPLAETLADLVREQVVDLVPLGGLTEEEVGKLLAEVAAETLPPGLASAVHARTEGNPLYTMEVARMLAASGGLAAVAGGGRLDVPDTVRLAIGQRLRVLSPACQELLALASLFGREFRAGAVARASGVDTQRLLELLDEAAAAHIVDAMPNEPGRWRFAHALFGETLADSQGAAARAALHAKAAAALASDPRAAEYASEIAHHWFEAGPAGQPDQAVTWSCRAAEQALGLLAHEEATRLYRKAVTALDWSAAPDDARRAEVLLGLGEACKRAGETSEAKQAFLETAALARKMASPQLLTRAALGFAPARTFAERLEPDVAVTRLLEEAIAAWEGSDSGLHACALARLALALFFGDRERSVALAELSLAMARRIGDAATLRYVLARWLATYLARRDPKTRLGAATELVQLAEEAGDLEALAVGRRWRCVHLLESGDATAMRREQVALARLSEELRQPVWFWYARVTAVSCAMLDGRFEDARRATAEALRVGQAALPYAARAHFVFSMMLLAIFQGRAGEFASEYRSMVEAQTSPASISPLAWIESELGNVAEASRIVERVTANDFVHVGNDIASLIVMCFLAEACAFLRDGPRAERLYAIMAPLTSRWVRWVVWGDAVPSLGPVTHYLGLLARTLGRLDEAAVHFEDAIAAAERAAAPPFLARAQFEYALVLRSRGGPSDAERAAGLLAEARATADALGMAGLRAKIDTLGGSRAVEADSSMSQIFRRDGDLWTIAYAGKEIRLRDMRGLHYLAMLLREPGREFHATDLVRGGVGPSFVPPIDDTLEVSRGLGDAGERLDDRARAAYRTRLAVLDEGIAEAERARDLGRLEHVSTERDALVAELSAAARGTRASSDAERARVTATKGIKVALERIAASHPELGAHLHATVHRGYFCSYVPDPRHPIDWDG